MKRVTFNVKFSVEIEFDENEIDEQDAIDEICGEMCFPCDDTENVTIIEQKIINTTDEE